MTELFEALETSPVGTRRPLNELLGRLRFGADGLLPAIAQRDDTGEVLMLAWMTRESLAETLATGRVCYWSRSRARLWRKGEESGHVQQLVELRADCDGDTLLLKVRQTGPACHTDRPSCFYLRVAGEDVIVSMRREVDPSQT